MDNNEVLPNTSGLSGPSAVCGEAKVAMEKLAAGSGLPPGPIAGKSESKDETFTLDATVVVGTAARETSSVVELPFTKAG